MEEVTMGVESVEVANQPEESVETVETVDTQEEVAETGVEEAVAEQSNEGFEKAFAKRLAQERAKLEQNYSPYKGLIEELANDAGMNPEEFVEVVRQQKELERIQQEAEAQGEADYEKYQLKKENEMLKLNNTRQEQERALESDPHRGELFKRWKDEVKDIANKFNTDLRSAFTFLLDQKFDEVMSTKQREAEQSTIQNIVKRDNASVGSVNGTPAMLKTDIWSMSSNDFGQMLEKAKRGELKI